MGVLSRVQRRRRWPLEKKIRIGEETYLPGMSVSLVARQHGLGANQLFTWRRLTSQGALTAATAGEEVVPASAYRALEAQVAELQRLLGKETVENEILRSRSPGPQTQKSFCCARPRCRRVAGERGGRGGRCLAASPLRHAPSRTVTPSGATAASRR